MASDRAGGAVIAWNDARGDEYDIYARGVDASGVPLWRTNGVPVCAAPDAQILVRMVSDGAGGAVLTWEDWRDTAPFSDIYAHYISGAGSLSIATLLDSYAAAFDGNGIIVTWTLSETGSDVEFIVGRSENESGAFADLSSARIEKNNLTFTFTDTEFQPGAGYRYRVDVREGEKREVLFDAGPVETPAASTALFQNHPNSFNPSTEITYSVPADCRVTLDVYDVSGRLVCRLADRDEAAGVHAVRWNGLDARGSQVRSGIYFHRLRAGKEELSRRMMLRRRKIFQINLARIEAADYDGASLRPFNLAREARKGKNRDSHPTSPAGRDFFRPDSDSEEVTR